MGFDPGFECPACLATLKSSDRMKQSVWGWLYIYNIYIYIYIYIYICTHTITIIAQSAGAVEYTDCTSAEE